MSPWTVYLFNQFDALLSWTQTGATVCWILALICFCVGAMMSAGEKIDSAAFIQGQTVRHFAFKLVPTAIILTVLTVLVPTTQHACQAHPQCVWGPPGK